MSARSDNTFQIGDGPTCRVELSHTIPAAYPEIGCIEPDCRLCQREYEEAVQQCVARGGHQFVDDDPGDPEVGPCPDVFCVRCGYNPLRDAVEP